MNKVNDVVDYSLMILGFSFSIENINNLMGFIILVIQFTWLFIKLTSKTVYHIRHKSSLAEIEKDFKDTIEEMKDLTDPIDKDIDK